MDNSFIQEESTITSKDDNVLLYDSQMFIKDLNVPSGNEKLRVRELPKIAQSAMPLKINLSYSLQDQCKAMHKTPVAQTSLSFYRDKKNTHDA